jgi:hypothetical protein
MIAMVAGFTQPIASGRFDEADGPQGRGDRVVR